jgi:hypothetical protein
MLTFDLGKVYQFEAPVGEISQAGIAEVKRFIFDQKPISDPEWVKLNPDNKQGWLSGLPDDWDWTWVVQRGEYAGTFPKRVSAYYFKRGLKCPPSFLTILGNIARAHSLNGETYRFDFVDQFDWEAGDFGDDGSCYWGKHAGARQMLADNGAFAVRFFDAHGDGIGRAWLYETRIAAWVLWNGYGLSSGTLTIARVLAAHFGTTYKKIFLNNRGLDNGMLWINGGAGYVLGAQADIEPLETYNFRWDDVHVYRCYSCGDSVAHDDVHFGGDDEPYCESCCWEIWESCERCGHYCYRDDINIVDGGNGYVCDSCLNRYYAFCDNCDEYRPTADIRRKEGEGLTHCDVCAE